MKVVFSLTICLILLSSCLIRLNTGNGYDELDEEQKQKVRKLSSFEETKPNYIYEITGEELKQELVNHDHSLVYLFKSGCPSDNCLAISVIENYAKQNNLDLFLVLVGYSDLKETLIQKPKHTLFSINSEAYKTDKSWEYVNQFRNDLGYYAYTEGKKFMGNYVFFTQDSIIDIRENLNQ